MITIVNIFGAEVLLDEVSKTLLTAESYDLPDDFTRIRWANSNQVLDAITADKIRVWVSGVEYTSHTDQTSILRGESLSPTTVDQIPISRLSSTKTGWHFSPRYITWKTASYGSLHNKKVDTLTDYGDASLRFWKVVSGAWVELLRSAYASDADFQTALDTDCTITTMDWQTTYDFDIRGAVLITGTRPTSPAYGYVQAAPDLAPYGLDVSFMDGGIPLHLVKDYSFIANDGRTVKSVVADPINNSNKFRVIIEHAAGAYIDLALGYEHYRA